ncbi:hypothetical protein [Legionella brunensis]|uniref:Uncharacterized protein n=1 Tax=Legionella brunensis TaxID=29422 RepID=A0A0W0SMC5_9GAMM|nr:hypothetical protein [Legionella brunensis]KTC84462.1 hypothetical protein Lbru_1330 [Legionella brunensis]
MAPSLSFFSRKVPSKQVSERKGRFLKAKEHGAYQLVVEDYEPILQHYIEKYGLEDIAVVINGTTEFGRKTVSENAEEIQKNIDLFENEDLQYANLVRNYWVLPSATVPAPFYLNKVDDKKTDFSPYYEELYNALKDDFLDERGRLKELSLEQLKRLNQICLRLNCREKLEEYRVKIVEDLNNRKQKICLTKEQSLEEIKRIQKNLGEDESVIYFFTNNVRTGPAHFEFVQIKKNEIIKPIHWFLHSSNIIGKNDLNNIFIPDISDFIKPYIKPQYLQPQVDEVSCGTLGILYLKELLKNNCRQLNDFTLSLPIYKIHNREVSQGNLFFPSPHVLRYSQSSFYNDVILAMVKHDHETTIKFKDANYKIKPLKVILEDSIKLAKADGNMALVAENQRILKNLPAFREKWLMEYKTEIQKRKAMQGEKYNLYLAYSTKRMQALAHHPEGLQKEQANEPDLMTEKATKNVSLIERIKKTLQITEKKTPPRSYLFHPEEAITKVVDNPLYEGDKFQENPFYEPKK